VLEPLDDAAAAELLAERAPWRFHVGLRYARAVLATDAEAKLMFDRALADDLKRWPMVRGRLLLAYGSWLRRRHRVAESRSPLRTARDDFDALGGAPWATEHVLSCGPPVRSASCGWVPRGTRCPRRSCTSPSSPPTACPTERSASSFTSPTAPSGRTSTVVPKLGITSRSQLSGALVGAQLTGSVGRLTHAAAQAAPLGCDLHWVGIRRTA
jgi:hypothetical protein